MKIKFNSLAISFLVYLAAYLILYFGVLEALVFAKHMPRQIANFCFSFPQIMFPFDKAFWSNKPILSSDGYAVFADASYLLMFGLLFSYLTKPIKKSRNLIPLGFLFAILSVVVLNLLLWVAGVSVEISMP